MSYEAIIAQLVLQGLQQALAYQQLVAKAKAAGRAVNDEDVAELGELGNAIRAAARAEADRQRAGG